MRTYFCLYAVQIAMARDIAKMARLVSCRFGCTVAYASPTLWVVSWGKTAHGIMRIRRLHRAENYLLYREVSPPQRNAIRVAAAQSIRYLLFEEIL